MKRRYFVYLLIMLTVIVMQDVIGAGAAGISDACLKAIFPAGSKVIQNTTGSVSSIGRMTTEIIMNIPYQNQGTPSEYVVEFYCRRQILNPARKQSEMIVRQKMAQFVKGEYLYWDTPLEFNDAGSTREPVEPDGHIRTVTVASPQRQEVMGGMVWFQRTEEAFEGEKQVFYECHYAARVGDFVATLDIGQLPDSRGKADEWFKKLIALCK